MSSVLLWTNVRLPWKLNNFITLCHFDITQIVCKTTVQWQNKYCCGDPAPLQEELLVAHLHTTFLLTIKHECFVGAVKIKIHTFSVLIYCINVVHIYRVRWKIPEKCSGFPHNLSQNSRIFQGNFTKIQGPIFLETITLKLNGVRKRYFRRNLCIRSVT